MDKDSDENHSPYSPEASASFAVSSGLRYVSDAHPGFRRRRAGKGFYYLDPDNCRVSSDTVLRRIKGLAVPPAWEGVWICRHENGHLQATGRDIRERKQYRYHQLWTQARNETKFEKLLLFGKSLPALRARVESDLNRRGYPKAKILAAVVRVMEMTSIRIGNDVYAEENDSYGLTTMLNRHAKVHGSNVKFKFKGKSGVQHNVEFEDPRLSRIIWKCQHLPGEELFAFEDDDGHVHDVGSHDVNEYLHEVSGQAITAKDFRTWSGTTRAVEVLAALGPCQETTKKARKQREVEVIQNTAAHLRNTVAVCRKYYVHPAVFDCDLRGELHRLYKKENRRKGRSVLNVSERVLLELLHLGS